MTNRPAPAVAYDATTGRPQRLEGAFGHFTLSGWSDEDTFFGVAEKIGQGRRGRELLARQVVTCELSNLTCTPVSPLLRAGSDGQPPNVLMAGETNPY